MIGIKYISINQLVILINVEWIKIKTTEQNNRIEKITKSVLLDYSNRDRKQLISIEHDAHAF